MMIKFAMTVFGNKAEMNIAGRNIQNQIYQKYIICEYNLTYQYETLLILVS
jgi:hypothetical protein